MPSRQPFFRFLPDGVSFISEEATALRLLYFPLCGVDAQGIKSAVTPFLSGDIKLDKNHFLTKPTSREDLRQPVRNFFVHIEGEGVFSLVEPGHPDSAYLEAGPLWHKLIRRHLQPDLELTALNFVPVSGETIELMQVTVRNLGQRALKITPTASVPIFGRGLANKHDHEHVTALLNRIQQLPEGVLVKPTMHFNEEGHKPNDAAYYVFGFSPECPLAGSFPTIESFCGERGTLLKPEAVLDNLSPRELPLEEIQGKEAIGALRFASTTLSPGQSCEFFLILGIADSAPGPGEVWSRFNTSQKYAAAWAANKDYWRRKRETIHFKTKDPVSDAWVSWVTLQPVLRRIFGCSFLPDHDYGKGGRGWRDLWQDLLSLILIEPEHIRQGLLNNFAGIRIDGSNATIIGSGAGEFVADRNAITRVWMDHGVWPFLTTLLYIQQTGDYDILLERTTYFRDPQQSRTFLKDASWTAAYGNKLKSRDGKIYAGTVLEHLLLQNVVPFFNVGEHNVMRLESADWNDGLDMAFERGESVAFMSIYGGNLLALADLLEELAKRKGLHHVSLALEMMILLDSLAEKRCNYEDPQEKKRLLFDMYFKAVQPELSGEQVEVPIEDLIRDLRLKGEWIFRFIRTREKVAVTENGRTFSWFNGYYDNAGERLEGPKGDRVGMTLTGQVFPLMSGLATAAEVQEVDTSVRRFLKDEVLGGLRLNTDFGRSVYPELGRAFGFAYGTKENGAFFSHMSVMYAYGLYKNGFARQGYEVLQAMATMAMDSERAKILPGIPEYFDSKGRGMYHYLTGSASWYILTLLTQAFGVRGDGGDLLLAPQLVAEQFDQDARAQASCPFAGKKIRVIYENSRRCNAGEYRIVQVWINQERCVGLEVSPRVKIARSMLLGLPDAIDIRVVLG